jgi:predicted HTH transcriptional regulator
MNKLQESVPYNSQHIQQLKKLVAKGEGQNLEFKRKASHPEKIVREMVAFANSSGGILLLGIGDDGSIPGLKYPEGESHVVHDALKYCKPSLKLKETFIPIGNSRTVIKYEIPESAKKPHLLNMPDHSKEVYVRVDDKSIKASREVKEIVRRVQQKKDIRFRYGEHETLLMKYLEENSSITLKKFVEISRLKKFYASKKLVILVLADVLKIAPHEKGDIYSLAFRS